MDSEIMAIMSQYMPLDNQRDETQPLRQDSTAWGASSMCSFDVLCKIYRRFQLIFISFAEDEIVVYDGFQEAMLYDDVEM